MANLRVVGALLVFAAGVARAAPPADEPRLQWTAPIDCPDTAAVRARIELRAGATIAALDLGAIAISVRRDGDGLVAAIDLGTVAADRDVRELRSASCEELADAVAMIVARATTMRGARRDAGVDAVIDNRRRGGRTEALDNEPIGRLAPRPSPASIACRATGATAA